MIPMSMADKNVGIYGTLFQVPRDKPIAQGFYAGTEINNDKTIIGADFKTGSVAAVNNRG
jgi:hypothetical protein